MNHMQSGPRVLLRRLREVMAESLAPQDRLDKIVDLIATNMIAEVCSVYVLRADNVLELFATKGLNPDVVHEISMRVGEGLVGTIAASARALNLDDAQNHPSFAFFPDSGEQEFSSFLGVPILRSGRSLGVLVVQNKEKRTYREDEVEAFETTAMVLAELVAAGELEGLSTEASDTEQNRPRSLDGQAFADGIGVAKVMLHDPRVLVTNLFNEDADAELERLSQALGKLRLSINDMLARNDVPQQGETREVLETYRMFANDRGWVRRMEEAINNGLTAEGAVEKVQNDHQARLRRVTDPYLRDRLNDFDDLAYRLLRELVGKPHGPLNDETSEDVIIVARNMGAAELLDYSRENLRGLVLEDGSPASHVVIVARALGIPVLGQTAGVVSQAESGDEVIIDGRQGTVHLRPTLDLKNSYLDKIEFQQERLRQYAQMRDKLPVTRDGVEMQILMNAGILMDLPQLAQSGASGIGLFRTELQFMVSSTFPRPGQQEALYRQVMLEAGDKPVTFRTLDIGGDKVLPYLKSVQEENPALGWRAVRLALDRPVLLKAQMRAFLRAAAGRELRIMLPMITEVREVHRARQIMENEYAVLERFGHAMPTSIKVGAMIEVPSLLFQLDELMAAVDFVSVGSNDLFQFVTATDRGSASMAERFDTISRPFARVLKRIVDSADKHAKPLTLCGEMAGRPLEALMLFGLGFKSISMSPVSIGPVKSMISNLDLGKLQRVLLPAIDEIDANQTLRELLLDFMDAEGIAY